MVMRVVIGLYTCYHIAQSQFAVASQRCCSQQTESQSHLKTVPVSLMLISSSPQVASIQA